MHTESILRVPSDVKQLTIIRRFVEEQALALSVEPAAIHDLVLAVNEMATNIMLHGYRGNPGEIEIDMRQVGDGVAIRLRDCAPQFDPTSAPSADTKLPLHRRPLGGMGIHLTRELMDELAYRALAQGGNELTLLKYGVVENHREE
jgi:serine/threonine-protein kinase RsbW